MAVSFYSTTGFTAQEVMRIGSDGNIGIGTASPRTKLSMELDKCAFPYKLPYKPYKYYLRNRLIISLL